MPTVLKNNKIKALCDLLVFQLPKAAERATTVISAQVVAVEQNFHCWRSESALGNNLLCISLTYSKPSQETLVHAEAGMAANEGTKFEIFQIA